MPMFQRKPPQIEAHQLTWANWDAIADALGDTLKQWNPAGAHTITAEETADTCGEIGPDYIAIYAPRADGSIVLARHGEWLVNEGPGWWRPVAPAEFAAHHEEVPSA